MANFRLGKMIGKALGQRQELGARRGVFQALVVPARRLGKTHMRETNEQGL